MSRQEKLISQLLSVPKDFTWDELCKIVAFFGYNELTGGKRSGSRRRFVDSKKNIITIHKPHPTHIVKSYAIREVIAHLKEKGHLKDE